MSSGIDENHAASINFQPCKNSKMWYQQFYLSLLFAVVRLAKKMVWKNFLGHIWTEEIDKSVITMW